jgi:hypothetical protein
MYKLEITDRARDDADAAYEWMAENVSADFADKWYRGLLGSDNHRNRKSG